MDNRNSPYGQMIMQLLGQLMKGGTASQPGAMQPGIPPSASTPQNIPSAPSHEAGAVYFAKDETESTWRREEKLDLLAQFCREGYAMARRHGHFLIGTGSQGTFLAVPGRFLLEEQPAGGVTGFTLWQPLAGGEDLYDTLENMAENTAETVYGYWIARLDPETLKLSEV